MAVVGVLVGVVACSAPGSARFLENWPYEKLMKESDLVVIANAVRTEETDDEPPKHPWTIDFVGQNTTFKVLHLLKGKVDGKEIKVLHFKWGKLKKDVNPNDPFAGLIEDGPLFAAFHTRNGPDHMLFLKSLKDGRYEPVSGRIDPQLSVRVLSYPPDEIKKEQ
jgi:hypothetical protein